MDANFSFPRHQAAIPRPRTAPTSPTGSADPVNRDSNALRASVLDTALQLGIGTNSTIANWMFNNSLEEVEEEDVSPALTHGSTASEESRASPAQHSSIPFASTQFSLTSAQGYMHSYNPTPLAFGPPAPNSLDSPILPSANDIPKVPTIGAVDFPDIPIPPRPTTPLGRGKLKKKRSDGFESDGGYVSDNGKKKKGKRKGVAREDGNVDTELAKKERAKEAKNRAKEEKLQEKRQKEEERKRKKSHTTTPKASKMSDDGHFTGYETDAGAPFAKSVSKAKSQKAKSKISGDVGYETDSGYVSSTSAGPKRSKSRFFGLGTKQSKPELRDENPMPISPVEREPMPLPIALRFASTLPSSDSTTMVDTSCPPPLPPATNTAIPPSLLSTLSISTSPSLFNSASSLSASSPSSATSQAFPNVRSVVNSSEFPPSAGGRALMNRESYGSGESGSSSSSNPKRMGFNIGRRDSRVSGRTESLSTVTSSEAHHPASTPTPTPTKLPAVAIPPTHFAATSPLSPPARSVPYPDPSRVAQSPSMLSPPSLLFSPSARSNPGSRIPSPVPSVPKELIHPSQFPPVAPLRLSPQVRPRNPPTDGFGHRSPTSPQNSLGPLHALTPRKQEWASAAPKRLSPTPSQLSIIASSEYIVPSPRLAPLTSPNVLAYYDIPPPSPPPSGPLPSVPGIPGSFPHSVPRVHPPQHQDREPLNIGLARDKSPPSQLLPANVQRGKHSPFPVRPVTPVAPASESVPLPSQKVEMPRYEVLHALATQPPSQDARQVDEDEWDSPVVKPLDAGRDYDEEEQDIREVLERFEDTLSGAHTGRTRSFEAIRKRLPGRVPSEYYEDEEEVGYAFSDERTSTEESGERTRSVYSRASLMDPDKSEDARERFIRRVADIYDGSGRDNGQAIPPIPKIPDSLLSKGAGAIPSGRSWNRF